MRWPIYLQLLLPVLSVVVTAIGVASALSAWLAVESAEQRHAERLQQVVVSLTDAAFPLTPAVLQKMRGLSGAEFIVLETDGRVDVATTQIPRRDLDQIRILPLNDPARSGRYSFAPRDRFIFQNRSYLVDRIPVKAGPNSRSVAVLYPEDQRDSLIRQAFFPPLLVGGGAAVVVMLLTSILARRLVLPIQRLRRQTAVIAEGDFTRVAVGSRNDEIRDLATSINQMVERLEHSADHLRRHERLRTLGQLGGGIAHQIRNAVTGARMALDLHRRECPLEPNCEALDVALRQLMLMEAYLQRFLTLGRPGNLRRKLIELGTLVADTLPLVRPACAHAKIDLDFMRPPYSISIEGDPAALEQLLINLLLNAVEAAGQDAMTSARVIVEATQDEFGRAALWIKDSGPGPTAEIGGQMFEPLVSDKPDGTGLGLAFARQIAVEHDGTLEWERQGELTCFVVRFPAVATPQSNFLPIATERPHG